jgi:hypothetical protein
MARNTADGACAIARIVRVVAIMAVPRIPSGRGGA